MFYYRNLLYLTIHCVSINGFQLDIKYLYAWATACVLYNCVDVWRIYYNPGVSVVLARSNLIIINAHDYYKQIGWNFEKRNTNLPVRQWYTYFIFAIAANQNEKFYYHTVIHTSSFIFLPPFFFRDIRFPHLPLFILLCTTVIL